MPAISPDASAPPVANDRGLPLLKHIPSGWNQPDGMCPVNMAFGTTRFRVDGTARGSIHPEPALAELREQVRRLERAHSAQRAGQAAVPLGLPAIDALLPDGGLLTGALHEIEAGTPPPGRIAAPDGAGPGFPAFLMGRFAPGPPLRCRPPPGVFAALPYPPPPSPRGGASL